MAQTFEEWAGPELDALYQGALFLSGGHLAGAERLLIEAVTLAFKEHAAETQPAEVERWLEVRLVRSFLRHLLEGPTVLPVETLDRISLAPGTFDSLESSQLFSAAASVPAWPRAALWLVLLRRWSYEDAAAAMDIDVEAMDVLLGYRDALMRKMLSSSRHSRTGTGIS
jgi:DNA-directed RNA polymerase specialized sigma24 family protein